MTTQSKQSSICLCLPTTSQQQAKDDCFVAGCCATNKCDKLTVPVTNVEELYLAVNDTLNAGKKIVMAPGYYQLDATHPRPNTGRLELQEDMELWGFEGHPEYVTIDASALPATSFNPPPPQPNKTGAIRIGRGCNTIKWLTIKGNASPSASSATALSAIDTDLQSDKAHVILAHLVISGSQTGIDIRNATANSANRILEAEIYNNELVNNTVGAGQGITVQNSNGATAATIRAILKRNYSHGNYVGIRVHNLNTNFGGITICSCGDRFEGNGVGCIFNAGFDNDIPVPATANGNLLVFNAYRTSIQANNGTLPPAPVPPASGIYAVGGLVWAASGKASNNRLEIGLYDCAISGNPGTHPNNVFGAQKATGSGVAGTSNLANIHLYGVTKSATFQTTPSDPTEPSPATNIVNIF